MLTTDLIRATVRQSALHPRFVDVAQPDLIALAEAVIDTFNQGVGDTVREVDEAVLAAGSETPDVLLTRGLAKLCWDLSETESPLIPTRSNPERVVSPQEIRATLFGLAASAWPVRPEGGDGFSSREDILARAAEALDLTPADLERGLYADLGSAQHLLKFEAITPRALLERYNLALAQSCLLRAREVRLDLPDLEPKRAQALVRALKFRRLLYRVETREQSLQITLDGPLSLFKQTSRYGLELAQFLPDLLLCERFSLEADLRWGRGSQPVRDVTLKLSDRSPLITTKRDRGTWTSAEEEHFQKSFAALDSKWTLERSASLIDLDGRDVLVPDYLLVHEDGRQCHLELVFAWRMDTFLRRAELLSDTFPRALVIAISDRGRLDEQKGDLPSTLSLYRFKGVIQPKRILEFAEQVAERPAKKPEPEPPKAKARTPRARVTKSG
jgi:predicted nuclease of restriction endonuclease-like RecB superfamily